MRRGSGRLVLRRLAQVPVILLCVYAIAFSLVWLVPGNPLQRPGARRPPPEVVAAMEARYDLDNPWGFAGEYLAGASGLAWLLGERDGPIFDLGPSLRHENWTVNEILASQLPASITLGTSAILLALGLGLSAGVIGAMRPGSWADVSTLALALAGISLPTFVTGTVLLILLPVKLGVLPVGGWGGLQHLLLPAVTLSLPFAAYIARLVRHGMIEQLASNHVRAARARGLSEVQVVLGHALKNAFLPVLSYLGPAAAAAMTGSFVVEKVFAVPGIGTHFVDAVLGKDITLVMGVVLVYATMLVLFNLLVDACYGWIDPRIATTG